MVSKICDDFLGTMHCRSRCINSSLNNKFLDWSKMKASADEKINVTEKNVLEMVENIVGKRENAGYQHFLLFQQYFKRLHFQGLQKSGVCGKEF